MQDSNSLPIVSVHDADFYAFYVGYNKEGEDKTLEQCIEDCDSFISNINRYARADYYVGYLTEGKCFRYDINPSYKANRKYNNMPKYLKEIREHLRNKHNFISQEGWESDDLVVSFKAQNSQFESILVSPDKDILNLPGKHLNPKKMAFKRTSESEASEFFNLSLIKGDFIDGLPGLKGKAEGFYKKRFGNNPSTIGAILDEYITHYGEIEGIKNFYTTYNCLKLIDTVPLEPIKLNEINKVVSE